MKYLRFISKEDNPCTGILQEDGSIEMLDGDILGPHQPTGRRCSTADIKQYLPPVDPPNIIALGLNYRDHAHESNMPIPAAPIIFLKATSSLTAHQCPIILPHSAPSEVDYEAELAIVIGRKTQPCPPEQARQFIFGYTCANDVSARDCQFRLDKQWARAKSLDTFAPVGPVIETDLNPDDLRIRSFLNGICMQDSSTSNLIFSVADIVSYLSQNFTLLPGTIIMTGTPQGVGFVRTPPVFLKADDKITVEIEGIGSLENHVIAQQNSGDDTIFSS